MAFSDPIAELLTKIRNAKGARLRFVDLHPSKMKIKILEILKEKGFIENFLVDKPGRRMRVFLRYTSSRESVIQGLKRISTPGLRRYVGCREIPRVFNGMGIVILSTSEGGVIDGETARHRKLGGELLCSIW